jgi:hypothetical protein
MVNISKVGQLIKVENEGQVVGYFNSFNQFEFRVEGNDLKSIIVGDNTPPIRFNTLKIEGETVTDLEDFETKVAAAFPNANSGSGGSGASYLVYTALLNQSGTDAPVATVLENTLGSLGVWTRNGIGDYKMTAAGISFSAPKTAITLGQTGTLIFTQYIDDTQINIITLTQDGQSNADSWLSDTMIEIRVYP